MEGAQALERAGCWGVVLELVPSPLARLVTERIAIPTIGIGAGAHCDGQVSRVPRPGGLFSAFTPSFVKRYAEAGAADQGRRRPLCRRRAQRQLSGRRQSFGMKDEVLKRVMESR